jgi:hypothetical protein
MEKYKITKIVDDETHLHVFGKNSTLQTEQVLPKYFGKYLRIGDTMRLHINRIGIPTAVSACGLIDFKFLPRHRSSMAMLDFIADFRGVREHSLDRYRFNRDVSNRVRKLYGAATKSPAVNMMMLYDQIYR